MASSSGAPASPRKVPSSGRSGRSFDDEPSSQSSKALRQFGASRQPSFKGEAGAKQVVAVPRIVCELSRSLEEPLSSQELAQLYELLLRCVLLPLSPEDHLGTAKDVLVTDFAVLRDVFRERGVSPLKHDEVFGRAMASASLIMADLRSQLDQTDPFHAPSAFAVDKLYNDWLLQEQGRVEELSRALADEQQGVGHLFVKVLAAKHVQGVGPSGSLFVALSLDSDKSPAARTALVHPREGPLERERSKGKHHKRSAPSSPVQSGGAAAGTHCRWDEEFQLLTEEENRIVTVRLMRSKGDKISTSSALSTSSSHGKLVGVVSFPLSQLQSQVPLCRWFALSDKDSKRRSRKNKPATPSHSAGDVAGGPDSAPQIELSFQYPPRALPSPEPADAVPASPREDRGRRSDRFSLTRSSSRSSSRTRSSSRSSSKSRAAKDSKETPEGGLSSSDALIAIAQGSKGDKTGILQISSTTTSAVQCHHHRYFRYIITSFVESYAGLLEALPDMVAWLQSEYGRRYGVGTFFQRLCHLDLLVHATFTARNHFDLIIDTVRELHRLKHASALPRGLSSSSSSPPSSSSASPPLTRLEIQVWESLLESLKMRIEGLLSRYELMFPTVPDDSWEPGALNSVLRLVPLVIVQEDQRVPFIVACLHSSLRFSYNMSKMNEEQDVLQSDAGDCAVLAAATKNIILSVLNNVAYYAEEFIGQADLVPVVAAHYYAMLSDDVVEKFQGEMVLSNELFDLYSNLERLHATLHRHGCGSMQVLPLKKLFTPYLNKYIAEIEPRLMEWTSKYIAADKWKPLLPDVTSTDPQLHSSSVLDLFKNISVATQRLLQIYFDTTSVRVLFVQMAGRILTEYMRQIAGLCIDEMQASPDLATLSTSSARPSPGKPPGEPFDDQALDFLDMFEELKSRGSKAKVSIVITPVLCVRINNLVSLRSQTKSLINLLCRERCDENGRKEIQTAAEFIYTDIQRHLEQLIEMITTKMNHTVQATLDILLKADLQALASGSQKGLGAYLQPLMAYLDIELERLSGLLYIEGFTPFLTRVWYTLIRDIEGCLLPIHDPSSQHKHRTLLAQIIQEALQTLFDFFHAGGEGLAKEILNTQCELLYIAFKLFRSDTEALIEMFNALNAVEEEQARHGVADPARVSRRLDVPPQLTAAHVLCVLATRKRDSPEVKKLLKLASGSIQHRSLCARFGLPLTDVVVEAFPCKNALRLKGTLSVTSSALCFETHLWGDAGMQRIQLKSIINMTKSISQLLRRDNALTLELDDRSTVFFHGFDNRDRCFDVVLRAARIIGAPVGFKFPSGAGAPASPRLGSSSTESSPTPPTSSIGGHFDTPTNDEVKEYQAQSERFQRLFKLPETEPHVLHSLCNYRKLPGEIFISPNHVCFAGKRMGLTKSFKVNFKEVADIKLTSIKEIHIKRVSDGKVMPFSKFLNPDNVHEILVQLCQRAKAH